MATQPTISNPSATICAAVEEEASSRLRANRQAARKATPISSAMRPRRHMPRSSRRSLSRRSSK